MNTNTAAIAMPPPIDDVFEGLNPGILLIIGSAIGKNNKIIVAIVAAKKFESHTQRIDFSLVFTTLSLNLI